MEEEKKKIKKKIKMLKPEPLSNKPIKYRVHGPRAHSGSQDRGNNSSNLFRLQCSEGRLVYDRRKICLRQSIAGSGCL